MFDTYTTSTLPLITTTGINTSNTDIFSTKNINIVIVCKNDVGFGVYSIKCI